MEERFGHGPARISSEEPQIAAAIWHERELALIPPSDFVPSFVALTVSSHHRRVPVKARHYSLDVVAIEGIEITLDQFFLGRHFPGLLVC